MKYLISILMVLLVINVFAQQNMEAPPIPAEESSTAKDGIAVDDIVRTAVPGEGGVPDEAPPSQAEGALDDCIKRDAQGRCLQQTQGIATQNAGTLKPGDAATSTPTTPATGAGNADGKKQ